MVVLGVYPSHNGGAALIDNEGQIISAVNEGRLVREKVYWGFPTESISKVLEIANRTPDEVSHIAFAGLIPNLGGPKTFEETPAIKRMMEYLSHLPATGSRLFSSFGREIFRRLRDDEFGARMQQLEVEAPTSFYDHHRCHAASAYYTSPFDTDTLIVTIDGQGDFRSATIYTVARDHTLRLQSWTPFYHSLGKLWQYVTYNVGFDPMEDEGKVAVLSAYGDGSECIDVFRRAFGLSEDGMTLQNRLGCWNTPAAKRLRESLRDTSREDIAAGLQQRTEEVVTRFVDAAMTRFDGTNLAVAGGVFANVGLNQKLLELESVEDIYVHPNMGDGGLAVGAGYLHWAEEQIAERRLPEPRFIETVYYGPNYGDDEIKRALKETGVEHREVNSPHERTGELLAEGYVVGRFNGRLEYGPRALGNRSILVAPTDPNCTDWLNDRLNRTEFMPFSPSILEEHADEYLEDVESGQHAGKFMTITFDVTERCRSVAPAVVHEDDTSRPQIVTERDNPTYYEVLQEYYDRTSIPLVLNTSFNKHGDSIVNTPREAIDAYRDGVVDLLVLGTYLVGNPTAGPSVEPVSVE